MDNVCECWRDYENSGPTKCLVVGLPCPKIEDRGIFVDVRDVFKPSRIVSRRILAFCCWRKSQPSNPYGAPHRYSFVSVNRLSIRLLGKVKVAPIQWRTYCCGSRTTGGATPAPCLKPSAASQHLVGACLQKSTVDDSQNSRYRWPVLGFPTVHAR